MYASNVEHAFEFLTKDMGEDRWFCTLMVGGPIYENIADVKPLFPNVCEPGHEKTCLMSYANNKGADQPAHSRSLISTFLVRCLDSVMSLVSVTKISSLMVASEA